MLRSLMILSMYLIVITCNPVIAKPIAIITIDDVKEMVDFRNVWQLAKKYSPYDQKMKVLMDKIAGQKELNTVKTMFTPAEFLATSIMFSDYYQEGFNLEITRYLDMVQSATIAEFNANNIQDKIRLIFDAYSIKARALQDEIQKNQYIYSQATMDKKAYEYQNHVKLIHEKRILLQGLSRLPYLISQIRQDVRQDVFGNISNDEENLRQVAEKLINDTFQILTNDLALFDPQMLEEEKAKIRGQLNHIVYTEMLKMPFSASEPLPTLSAQRQSFKIEE